MRKSNKGKWYAELKMRHYIICLLQEAYPDLAKRMEGDPDNATNILSAFLPMVALKAKDKLTPEVMGKILKTYRLL